MKPTVIVVATTHFLGLPKEFHPLETQDKGSESARLIEFAGRTCYESVGRGRDSETYHENIKKINHGSVCEHSTIAFYISGISRGVSHELVRHRAGVAISQRSTRYVDESESEWAFHPLMDKYCSAGTWSSARGVMYDARQIYRRIFEEVFAGLVRDGVPEATAKKQARGAARGVLGTALPTSLVWTVNIRALRHFLEMRAALSADGEIRLLANALYEAALEIVPEYLNDYRKVPCEDGIGYALECDNRKI